MLINRQVLYEVKYPVTHNMKKLVPFDSLWNILSLINSLELPFSSTILNMRYVCFNSLVPIIWEAEFDVVLGIPHS